MSRRATATVGLTALALAVVLVIAMTTDRPASTAEPLPEPLPSTSTPAPTVDAAEAADRARQLERLAKKARAEARVVKLFQGKGCWEGDAPVGAVPSHALVTLPGQQAAIVPADVGYGIWLDGDPGTLHGFCP